MEELAGDTGTTTGLVKVETMRGTGASQGATGRVSNGTITLAVVGARRIFSSREQYGPKTVEDQEAKPYLWGEPEARNSDARWRVPAGNESVRHSHLHHLL